MIDFKPIVRGRTHAVRLVVTDSADESLIDVTGWRIRVGLGRSRRALGTEFTKESVATGDGALLGQVQIDFDASETSVIGPDTVTVDVSLSSPSGSFRPVLIGVVQVLNESEYLERFIQNQAGSGSTSQVANSQTESVSVLLDMSDDPSTDIRVNAILPGHVNGDRFRTVWSTRAKERGITFEEMKAEVVEFSCLQSTVEMQDIANMALYLASPFGKMITGQALSVCAGVEMMP